MGTLFASSQGREILPQCFGTRFPEPLGVIRLVWPHRFPAPVDIGLMLNPTGPGPHAKCFQEKFHSNARRP